MLCNLFAFLELISKKRGYILNFSKRVADRVIYKAAKGDKFALATLYHEFKKPVFNLAYKITLNADSAEDILQQVFEKVIYHVDTVRKPSAFNGWLKTITYRQSINYVQKLENYISIEDLESSSIDYSDAYSKLNTELLDLEKYLYVLNERERLVVFLFLIEGYEHKKIGDMLDFSENNSKQIYRRSLNKLKRVGEKDSYSGNLTKAY